MQDYTDLNFQKIFVAIQSKLNPLQIDKFNQQFKEYCQKKGIEQQNTAKLSQVSSEIQKEFLKSIFISSKVNQIKERIQAQNLFLKIIQEGEAIAIKKFCEQIQFQLSELTPRAILSINKELIDPEDQVSTDSSFRSSLSSFKRFDTGEAVKQVQNILIEKKFLENDPSNIELKESFWGQKSEQAIINLQKKNNFFADGVVDHKAISLLFDDTIDNKQRDKSNSSKDQQEEQKNDAYYQKENQVKGVSFDFIVSLQSINGIKIDNEKGVINFLKSSAQNSEIRLADLAIGLKVFCDDNIQYKNLSFSLDPYEPTQPEGPYLSKILYPDVIINQKIVAGTPFSELLFECDYLLKIMSLGVKEDCKTQYQYPPELVAKGLKNLQQYQNEQVDEKGNYIEKNKNSSWCRLWIYSKDIEVEKQGDCLRVKNVKIGIDARQMMQDHEGKLIDASVQDENDFCFQFAQKFTELYDIICKYYPCFEEIKKLYKAVALAKLIREAYIPIDITLIQQLIDKSYIKNYQDKVNTIKFQENIVREEIEKIPIDKNDYAKRVLEYSKMEITQENIQMALKQLIEKNNGSDQFFDTQKSTYTLTKGVIGGVDMKVNIKTKEVPIKKTQQKLQYQVSNIKKEQQQQKQQQAVQIKPQSQQSALIANKKQAQVQKTSQNQKKQQSQSPTKIISPTKIQKEAKKDNQDEELKSNISSFSTNLSQMSLEDIQDLQESEKNEEELPFFFQDEKYCSVCQKLLNLNLIKIAGQNNIYYCELHHPNSCYQCQKIVERGTTILGNKEFYDSENFIGKKVAFHYDCFQVFQNSINSIRTLEHENQQSERVNKSLLEQLIKIDSTISSLDQLKLQKSTKFVCQQCSAIQEHQSVICNKCNMANPEIANIWLKQKNEKQNQLKK